MCASTHLPSKEVWTTAKKKKGMCSACSQIQAMRVECTTQSASNIDNERKKMIRTSSKVDGEQCWQEVTQTLEALTASERKKVARNSKLALPETDTVNYIRLNAFLSYSACIHLARPNVDRHQHIFSITHFACRARCTSLQTSSRQNAHYVHGRRGIMRCNVPWPSTFGVFANACSAFLLLRAPCK